MTCDASSSSTQAPSWEDTTPHFSVSEKGDRITAPPVDTPGMLGFTAVVTFVLWIPASAAGALFFPGASQGNGARWVFALVVLYAFLPAVLTDLTVDEARDRFEQRTTAKRIAAIPTLAGITAGLLIAAFWTDGSHQRWLAAVSIGCMVGTQIAILTAWSGTRYTGRRLAWMVSMRCHGRRTPGHLREVTFLRKWANSDPQFRVIVEFAGDSGPQWVEANMTTTTHRVPLPGTAVVVTRLPHKPATEPLIELDFAAGPEFDPHHAEYTQPSAN